MPRVRPEPHQRSTHPYEGNELLRGLFIRAKDKKHRQLPLTPPGRQHPGPHATQAMPTPTPAVPGLALQPSAQLSAAEVKRPVGSHAEAQLLQPRGLVSRPDCLSASSAGLRFHSAPRQQLAARAPGPPRGQSGLPPAIRGDRKPGCGFLPGVQFSLSASQRWGRGGSRASGLGDGVHTLRFGRMPPQEQPEGETEALGPCCCRRPASAGGREVLSGLGTAYLLAELGFSRVRGPLGAGGCGQQPRGHKPPSELSGPGQSCSSSLQLALQ